MKKFIEIIKKKWVKDSLFTFIMVAFLIALFLAINVIVINLDLTPIDFTKEKLYTLSDESKKQISQTEQNVTLYFFGYTEEDTTITLAKQYEDINDKITVQIINTSERPDLASQYGVSQNSRLVVVQSRYI